MNFSYNAIIFDCDGVLFDSNSLKSKAFREILCAYPQAVVNDFITYHRRQGGVSRYVKLRAFFADFLRVSVNEQELKRLLSEFSNACQKLYQEANLTPGCLNLLEQLSPRIPLFVASGSDQEELNQVFARRNLTQFFQGIYGSPKTKKACVTEIMNQLSSNLRVVMIGDAESDWLASQEAGIDFIFMNKYSDAVKTMKKIAKIENFTEIETLRELLPS